ncbi:alpha/beta hydrolase [Devosia sp. 1566]|uniref:alpha/beta hydrolase n=1 Tax=Devosia sp. 1566 TaxID=2499144 RepID=UPI000FDC24E7|nr:alpha/beta hydrolase [Devosia sp. 1566]
MAIEHYRDAPGAGAEAPLFVLFHGTGGDENQFFALGSQLLPGARVVTPRGDVSESGALRFFRRTGEGVYDMDDLWARVADMAAFIEARRAESQPSKLVGLGYSNGANILAALQFVRPDLFDASVLMHPLIPFAPEPNPGLAGRQVLLTAGRRDPMVPAGATEALEQYFAGQGAQTRLFWHEGGHELRQEELLEARDFLSPFAPREA